MLSKILNMGGLAVSENFYTVFLLFLAKEKI